MNTCDTALAKWEAAEWWWHVKAQAGMWQRWWWEPLGKAAVGDAQENRCGSSAVVAVAGEAAGEAV